MNALSPRPLLLALLLAVVPGVGLAQAKTSQATASLAGKVVADSSEKPLVDAIIGLIDVGVSTRSDSQGNFELKGIKPGKHQVSVRLLGYQSIRTTLDFAAAQKVEGDFVLMKATTTLGTVEIKDRLKVVSPRLAEFEEHRKGPGQFLTADKFENEGGRSITDIVLRNFTGVRLIRSGGRDLLASTRNGNGSRDCYFQIILNNVPMTNVGPYDLGTVLTPDVIGLEYYTVANTPFKYAGTAPAAQCGTIVIWTK